QLVPTLRQQALEPARVAASLDPHFHRFPLQAAVELFRFARGMVQLLSHSLLRLQIQHRNLLEAGMKITAYNLHDGSFSARVLGLANSSLLGAASEPSLLSNQTGLKSPVRNPLLRVQQIASASWQAR